MSKNTLDLSFNLSYNNNGGQNANYITTNKFIVILTTRFHELIQLSTDTISIRTMLHHLTFGRNIGTQGYVTDLDWELYCQEVLDANFDGYTVQDAMGSWKSMPEDSKVVIINTNDTDLVKDCAQLYKEMYQQEAVGLFTTATPMEFI